MGSSQQIYAGRVRGIVRPKNTKESFLAIQRKRALRKATAVRPGRTGLGVKVACRCQPSRV